MFSYLTTKLLPPKKPITIYTHLTQEGIVALLDVDGTLLKGDGTLNEGLLQKLIENGVRDIYLFTNVSPVDIEMKVADLNHPNPVTYLSRDDLIRLLKERGFNVHGVITPADPSYNKGLGAAYKDLLEAQYQRIPQADYGDEEAYEIVQEEVQENVSTENAIPIIQELTSEEILLQDEEYLAAKKLFTTYYEAGIAAKDKFDSEKGPLFKYFLPNRPPKFVSCIVIDDIANHLEAVANENNLATPEHTMHLTTIHLDKKNKEYFSANPEELGNKIKNHVADHTMLQRNNLIAFIDLMLQDLQTLNAQSHPLKITYLTEIKSLLQTNIANQDLVNKVTAISDKFSALIADEDPDLPKWQAIVSKISHISPVPLSERERPVALLDIDNTLILDTREHGQNISVLNRDALKQLLAAGIKDIYLFSSMSLNDIVLELAATSLDANYYSRPKLIEDLQTLGFTVHGIITPADPVYNKGLGASYRELFLPQHQRINRDLTADNVLKDPEYIAAREAFRKCSHHNKKLNEHKKYLAEKGSMAEYFFTYKPRWFTSAVLLDDADWNIFDVRAANKRIGKHKRILTTTIHLDKRDHENYFRENAKPIVQGLARHQGLKKALDQIEDYLLSLESKVASGHITSIEATKFSFLQELKTAILRGTDDEIREHLRSALIKYPDALHGSWTQQTKNIVALVVAALPPENEQASLSPNTPRK